METKPDYSTMTAEEIAERLKPHVFASFEEALAWFRSQKPQYGKHALGRYGLAGDQSSESALLGAGAVLDCSVRPDLVSFLVKARVPPSLLLAICTT